jgi:hypothetical protein
VDTNRDLTVCANDCPGVDAESIIVGGAVLVATATGGLGFTLGMQILLGAGVGMGALVRILSLNSLILCREWLLTWAAWRRCTAAPGPVAASSAVLGPGAPRAVQGHARF